MNLEFKKLIKKYPNKIPTIVQKHHKSRGLPILKKSKFLIQKELTIGQLLHVIRKNISLDPSIAIYLFIDKKIYPSNKTIGEIFHSRQKDDFLYVYYIGENTFG